MSMKVNDNVIECLVLRCKKWIKWSYSDQLCLNHVWPLHRVMDQSIECENWNRLARRVIIDHAFIGMMFLSSIDKGINLQLY